MESPSRLFLEFASSGVVSKGELYLPVEAARRLIERCREKDIAILGLEAFEILDGKIHPRTDLIADFSEEVDDASVEWKDTVVGTARDAMGFLDEIARVAPTLHVNVTLKPGNP